jgi:hypothetical protein
VTCSITHLFAACRDAANNLLLRVLTMCLFMCRRASVGLHTIGPVGRWLSWPLRILARLLQRPLNQVGSYTIITVTVIPLSSLLYDLCYIIMLLRAFIGLVGRWLSWPLRILAPLLQRPLNRWEGLR